VRHDARFTYTLGGVDWEFIRKGPVFRGPALYAGASGLAHAPTRAKTRGRTKAKSHEHPERLEQEPDRERDRPGSVVAAPPEECRLLSGYSGGQIPTRASPGKRFFSGTEADVLGFTGPP